MVPRVSLSAAAFLASVGIVSTPAQGAFQAFQAFQSVQPFQSVELPESTLTAVDEGLLTHITRSADEAAERTEVVRGRVLVRRTGDGVTSEPLPATADPEQVARDLSARPDVVFAQAAYRVYPRSVPNDPLFPRQWNLSQLHMEQAWDLQRGFTRPVTVAVIDTGVAYTNASADYTANAIGYNGVLFPALGRLTLQFAAAPELGRRSRFVSPRDFIWNNERPLDLDGHGTHVAGTIGQLTNNRSGPAGIAPDVFLMPVKVLSSTWDDAFGSPNIGTDDTVSQGIRWAVDHGARVLNLSIGRTGPASPLLEEALRYAVGKGAFVAVAAGNGHEAGDPREVLSEIASRIDGVVSVGAVTRTHSRAYYSTVGPDVELMAPGGSFRTDGAGGSAEGGPDGGILQQTYDLNLVETFSLTSPGFAAPRFDVMANLHFAGTSSAVPHVSGIAALLMQRGVQNPAAIERLLKTTAHDLGPVGRDDEYGFGELDARAALRRTGLPIW